jgi:hypothetical protein
LVQISFLRVLSRMTIHHSGWQELQADFAGSGKGEGLAMESVEMNAGDSR